MAIGAFSYSELVSKGSLSQTGQVNGYKITENLSIPHDLPSYVNDFVYQLKHAYLKFDFKNSMMQFFTQHHWFSSLSPMECVLSSILIFGLAWAVFWIIKQILITFTHFTVGNSNANLRINIAIIVIAATISLIYSRGCTLTSAAQYLSNEQTIEDDLRLCQLEGNIYEIGSAPDVVSEVFGIYGHYYLLFTNGKINQDDFNNKTIGKNNVLVDLTNNRTYTGKQAYQTLLNHGYIVPDNQLADCNKVSPKQVKKIVVEKVSDKDN